MLSLDQEPARVVEVELYIPVPLPLHEDAHRWLLGDRDLIKERELITFLLEEPQPVEILGPGPADLD